MGRRDMRGLGIRLEHQLLEGKPLGVLRICGDPRMSRSPCGVQGFLWVCKNCSVYMEGSELRVGVGLWVSPVVGCKS